MTKDEADFNQTIAKPLNLHELTKEEPTHRIAGHQSRLDRIYLSHRLADQLDHRIRCVALPCLPSLVSSHRPVQFEIMPPDTGADQFQALPE